MIEYKIVAFKDARGEWRASIIHRNGNIIYTTGEGYKNKRDMKKSTDNFIKACSDGKVSWKSKKN